MTSTINVDCTILLALISDISHLSRQQLSSNPVGASQTHHKAIMYQIESEESAPMLYNELYPLLVGRDLQCTSHAAQQMREIVEIMATASERRRAKVLLGEDGYTDQPASAEAFGHASLHYVPDGLRLPMKVIDVDVVQILSTERGSAMDFHEAFPASVAAQAKNTLHLNLVNSSVFLYGWAHQITTLTSNRTVAIGLMKAFNDILDSDEFQGQGHDAEPVAPVMHVCKTARSLIGETKLTWVRGRRGRGLVLK